MTRIIDGGVREDCACRPKAEPSVALAGTAAPCGVLAPRTPALREPAGACFGMSHSRIRRARVSVDARGWRDRRETIHEDAF